MEKPETIDPIYSDLIKQEKEHFAKYKAKKAELDEIKRDWDTADALSGRAKVAKSRYFATEEAAQKELQTSRYFKLRAKTRKAEARKSYSSHFKQDKPWPPAEEYDAYLAENRLKMGSKSWDSRVPKWNERTKALINRAEPAQSGAETPSNKEGTAKSD